MKTFWLSENYEKGKSEKPTDSEIAIIGSGIAGSSVAYFLKQNGINFNIIDSGPTNASFHRNAGHILFGAGENYAAMTEIHGRSKAKTIFQFSKQFCEDIKNTIEQNDISCDYIQGNYLCVANNNEELNQITKSSVLLENDGFGESHIVFSNEFNKFAKTCPISAQANPGKFRDALLRLSTDNNHYEYEISKVEDIGGRVEITYFDSHKTYHDAAVLCVNAYSKLISPFFESRGLIEPFKGQIIVSKPMKDQLNRFHFSADHGYIYGTITADSRFLIGGWRNNVPGMEVGSFDLEINPLTENGLKQWVIDNTAFKDLEWEYSWSGIMGSSSTGLPFVGPTNSPQIFTVSGCTGYGFGFFHGASKLLVDIMLGNDLPSGYEVFNPNGK
jgi:glycine/D-amino acid oxidase-like deaminating enzyme